MRESVEYALEEKGYGVTSASGEAAIAALGTKDFDLVITDLMMPRTDGIHVLKKVKEFNPQTMVIIMTGTLDVSFAIQALRSDADDYILKPFGILC